MGRHELVVEARFKASPDAVWKVLSDPRRFTKWMSHVSNVEVQTPGPLRVGSLLRFDAKFGSHQVRSEVEVVDVEAPQRLAWKHLYDVLDGHPFSMATDGLTEFELDGTSRTTRVRSRVSFIGHGIKAAFGANFFLNHKVKPEIEAALGRLVVLCE